MFSFPTIKEQTEISTQEDSNETKSSNQNNNNQGANEEGCDRPDTDGGKVLAWVKKAIDLATGWKTGLSIVIITGFISPLIETSVNISYAGQQYIKYENLRNQLWQQLNELMIGLIESDCYSDITIVSHGFGTLIHVDWMADYKKYNDITLRHITMAGPLAVMVLRSEIIEETMFNALDNPDIRESTWIDCYSAQDWLCSAMPDSKNHYQLSKIKEAKRDMNKRIIIKFPKSVSIKSLIQRSFGIYHMRYFHETSVIETILSKDD